MNFGGLAGENIQCIAIALRRNHNSLEKPLIFQDEVGNGQKIQGHSYAESAEAPKD